MTTTTIYQNFKEMLIKTATKLGIDESRPQIELNKTGIDAHFSTTIALANAKKKRVTPQVLAAEFRDQLLTDYQEVFTDISIAGPGFINVTFNPSYLSKVIGQIDRAKLDYGRMEKNHQIVSLEEVSVNPTGYLHVGHARNAVIGDSLKRLFEFTGYDVLTEYYVNDAGNQINILAVTVFVYYLNQLGIKTPLPEEAYKGEGYELVANRLVEEYGDRFKDITFTNTQIDDEQVNKIFREKATAYFLEVIKSQLKSIGVEIGYYNSEQKMYDDHEIEKVLALYEQKGATYYQEGALFLKTTKYGDDKDRVLVKSDGKTYTYLTPDLASHNVRIHRTKANKLINVWGGDHHGYIARMKAGLTWLGNDPDILEIQMIQMVRVIKNGAEFKMSKRKGTAIWMIDLVEMIGKDALRYMLAAKDANSHMDLDIDLVQQKNASNPVYYAQYATARLHSILQQATDRDLTPNFEQTALLKEEKETTLLITLDNFQEVVKQATKQRSPHLITDYIQIIARQFHSYYAEFKIIDVSQLELTKVRLGLIMGVLQVLTNAFNLIGLDVIEEM